MQKLVLLCFPVDCMLAGRPTDSQLKNTTRTICCIYTVYLLVMGYKYTRNMWSLIDGIN